MQDVWPGTWTEEECEAAHTRQGGKLLICVKGTGLKGSSRLTRDSGWQSTQCEPNDRKRCCQVRCMHACMPTMVAIGAAGQLATGMWSEGRDTNTLRCQHTHIDTVSNNRTWLRPCLRSKLSSHENTVGAHAMLAWRCGHACKTRSRTDAPTHQTHPPTDTPTGYEPRLFPSLSQSQKR